MSTKSKKTRVITSGALVTLRARKNTSGKLESLYLDYYSNGERIYKFLKLKLYVNPKTEDEKQQNAEAKRQAIEQRTIYESELMLKPGSREGKGKTLFLPYMEICKNYPQPNGKRKTKGTKDCYTTVINLIKEEYGDNLTFNDITGEWCRNFRTLLINRLKQNTAAVYFCKITNVINHALKEKIILEDPLLSVDTISLAEARIEYFTMDELRALKEAHCDNSDLKKAGLTSSMTGLRAGDLMGLKWKHIKFTPEAGNFIQFIQQKTDSQSFLPIKESVMELLGERKDPEDRVFPSFRNDSYNNLKLRLWVANAGINKKVKFHMFRHTHAILLGEKGANLFQIKELFGHKSIRTTERYYAKLIDTAKKEVVNRLEDL